MTHSLLQGEHIFRRFATHSVLENVALQVRRGEIVSLVGPSGCGKSTLLRIIAGLDPTFDGTIELAGEPMTGPSTRIGIMFQEPRLLPWLNVEKNVRFIAGNRTLHSGRATGREIDHEPGNKADIAVDDRTRARNLLAEVGLAGRENAWPKALSGGMAQRVALARALYTRPDLLLLDEPFSAVDALTRMRLQDQLLSVAAAHRTAALIVTHDLDEALYLSDRIYVMAANPGRIVETIEVDSPRPRDRADPALAWWRAELLGHLDRLRSHAAPA